MTDASADDGNVVIDVCIACRSEKSDRLAGKELFEALTDATRDRPSVEIRPVDCFAVCDRPVTLALRKKDGWTYLLGDVAGVETTEDIITAAEAVGRAPSGVPPLKERPPFFRRGVIGRLPPMPSAPGRTVGGTIEEVRK